MSEQTVKRFTCPTCKAPTKYDIVQFPHFPFCTDRCKLIDLGAWANEEHKIDGDSEGFDDHFSEKDTF